MAKAEKIAKPPKAVLLPYPHSPGQMDLITWPGSGVAFCGRRWGKGEAGIQRILRATSEVPGMYWWVGLSWKSASMKRAWRLLTYWCSEAIRAAGMDPDANINRSNFEIRLPNGSEIWMRTAERPESLAGEGIRGAIVDEFTLMPEIVWTEYLQGTLIDYQGWAIFTGVPKGNNWGARLFRRVRDSEMGDDWKSWRFPSSANPHLSKPWLEKIRKTVPDLIWRQEYLAEIVGESGGVFRGVRESATAIAQEKAIPGHIYTMGVDFARLYDFTVFAVLDVTTSECVAMDRFRGAEYAIQVDRFMTIYTKFKPAIVLAESNNMGDPIIEQLNERLRNPSDVYAGNKVVPFVTSNQSKDVLIRSWAIAIETKAVQLPNDEIVIGEHQGFQITQTAMGNWKYSAPGTDHDDTVIAFALAFAALGSMPESMKDDFTIASFTKKSIAYVS